MSFFSILSVTIFSAIFFSSYFVDLFFTFLILLSSFFRFSHFLLFVLPFAFYYIFLEKMCTPSMPASFVLGAIVIANLIIFLDYEFDAPGTLLADKLVGAAFKVQSVEPSFYK